MVDNEEKREIEIDPLQAIILTLELGGPNAEKIANATDEEINELLSGIDKIKLIV